MRKKMSKSIDLMTRYYRLFPSNEFSGYAHEEFKADFNRSAFLVVDVYGLGFHPDDPKPAYAKKNHSDGDRPALTWLGSAEHEDRIVKNALFPALSAARKAGLPIILPE